MSNLLFDDGPLVARLKMRDESAFEELYDRYADALHGAIFNILKDEAAAADCLQDVMVKIWKKIQQYDRSKGRLFTWMLNVARNAAIDVTRSKAYKQDRSTDSIIPSENSAALKIRGGETNVDTIGLRDFFEKLAPEWKELLHLVYFKGYTHKEVAEELNMPLGTVKTRIRRGLKEMRIMMQG